MDPVIMIIRIPAILMALTIHELAHGFIAKLLGDNTAEMEGRLTINPFVHLDFIGALMLLFGPFGWAKPVPVNASNFKDPIKDMAIVALAGPLSNVIFAALAGLILRTGIFNNFQILSMMLYILFIINIGLAVFNLFPIYPLDGSRILVAFLKPTQRIAYFKAMNIVPMVFIILITAEWAFKIPIISYIFNPIFVPTLKFARKLFMGI
ncbi:MAG: site-2 protease family protein [Desulfobacterales bacterium]|nr:site-2 protease family protein [Desulfobacterales bacterium]